MRVRSQRASSVPPSSAQNASSRPARHAADARPVGVGHAGEVDVVLLHAADASTLGHRPKPAVAKPASASAGTQQRRRERERLARGYHLRRRSQ